MTLGLPKILGPGSWTAPSRGMLRVLCVGEQTSTLAAEAGQLSALEPVRVAANFVEAILLADDRRGWDLIIGAVSQEGTQLERAVQCLRSVNPRAKIVLLGEPTEEPSCRRAAGWGADDYFVLPTPLSLILQLTGMAAALAPPDPIKPDSPAAQQEDAAKEQTALAAELPPVSSILRPLAASLAPPSPAPKSQLRPTATTRPAPPPADPEPADASAPERGDDRITLVSLPLVVQSSLVTDILQAKADMPGRLVATLQTYIQWPGQLTFVPETREGAAPDSPGGVTLSVPVVYEAVRYGTLHLETGDGAIASQLDQAATWLGSWLAMARRQEQLRSMAITDELSGAYNRRYFTRFVEGLIERARAQRFRVSLLLFDIDDFKRYNDQFGHAAGDAIIRGLITLLRRCTRSSDIVARIGGDEFAVVFWDSEAPRQPNSQHPKDAIAATERFRQAIQAHDWAGDCNIVGQVSISGGIATFPWDADTLEALLVRADEAMLQAKRAGKNVIRIHGAEEM